MEGDKVVTGDLPSPSSHIRGNPALVKYANSIQVTSHTGPEE